MAKLWDHIADSRANHPTNILYNRVEPFLNIIDLLILLGDLLLKFLNLLIDTSIPTLIQVLLGIISILNLLLERIDLQFDIADLV